MKQALRMIIFAAILVGCGILQIRAEKRTWSYTFQENDIPSSNNNPGDSPYTFNGIDWIADYSWWKDSNKKKNKYLGYDATYGIQMGYPVGDANNTDDNPSITHLDLSTDYFNANKYYIYSVKVWAWVSEDDENGECRLAKGDPKEGKVEDKDLKHNTEKNVDSPRDFESNGTDKDGNAVDECGNSMDGSLYIRLKVDNEDADGIKKPAAIYLKKIEIVYDDDPNVLSGITSVNNNESHADDIVYTISGVRVKSDNLPTGIYIKNGKKYITK